MTPSWLDVPGGTPFPVDNLPVGSGVAPGWAGPRLVTRVGDTVVDLAPTRRPRSVGCLGPHGEASEAVCGLVHQPLDQLLRR
jgi:hypothetical protein